MTKIVRLTESDLRRIIQHVLKESDDNLTTKVMGGWLHIKEKKGCVKFVKYRKENGKWVFDQRWAQGITDQSGNSTSKNYLGVPATIKFVFSWLIKQMIPSGFDVTTLSQSDISSMYNNWKEGNPYVKTIYAKGSTKVGSESNADTKFNVYFGGDDTNTFCKNEWS